MPGSLEVEAASCRFSKIRQSEAIPKQKVKGSEEPAFKSYGAVVFARAKTEVGNALNSKRGMHSR